MKNYSYLYVLIQQSPCFPCALLYPYWCLVYRLIQHGTSGKMPTDRRLMPDIPVSSCTPVGVSSFGRIYRDSMNREQTEYHLDRELTDTLLTGYSVIELSLASCPASMSVMDMA